MNDIKNAFNELWGAVQDVVIHLWEIATKDALSMIISIGAPLLLVFVIVNLIDDTPTSK